MFDTMIARLEEAATSPGDMKVVTQRVRETLVPFLSQPLPPALCVADDRCYARHLIHCDPQGRWCAVAIVLRPGQSTPIHNHNTWGVIGVVQGREREVRYRREEDGTLEELTQRFNAPGEVSIVIPPKDVHRIEGASSLAEPTVSIHVYGGDVDKVTRAIFEQAGVEYVGPCATTPAP